jgi:hypothetical protein
MVADIRVIGDWPVRVHNRVIMYVKPTYHSLTAHSANRRLARGFSQVEKQTVSGNRFSTAIN